MTNRAAADAASAEACPAGPPFAWPEARRLPHPVAAATHSSATSTYRAPDRAGRIPALMPLGRARRACGSSCRTPASYGDPAHVLGGAPPSGGAPPRSVLSGFDVGEDVRLTDAGAGYRVV